MAATTKETVWQRRARKCRAALASKSAATAIEPEADAPAPDECAPPFIATFVLPETLDLRAAGPLAESLLELRGRPLDLDASAVRRLGVAGAQVLLSAARTWASDAAPFSIRDMSGEMGETLRTLALIGHFETAGALA